MKVIVQHVLIGFFTLIFCQKSTWERPSASLEWKSISNRMTFRDPLIFIPYEIKPGLIYNNGILSWTMEVNDSLTVNKTVSMPYNFGKIIEVDLVRTNIPYIIFNRNYFDFQLGLGMQFANYSRDSSSFSSFLPDTLRQLENTINQQNFYFYPKSYGLNINASLSWQLSKNIITYIYNSIGYNNLFLYKSETGEQYLNGKGLNQNIGIGTKFLFRKPKNNYNFYWGIEGKISNLSINEVANQQKLSPINSINLNGFVISLTTGILFGAKQTEGDIAYSYMIKNDFISAAKNFEYFLSIEKRQNKREKAIKMLQYCQSRIPYQQVDYGLDDLFELNYNKAVEWFEAAEADGDENLIIEIQSHRKRIASELLDSVQYHKNQMTIAEAEKIVRNAIDLYPEHKLGNRILAGIYLDKGILNTDIGNYAKATQNYLHAIELYPNIETIILEKFDQIINALMKDAYFSAKSGELHLIIKSLRSIIKLNPELASGWEPYIIKLETKLSKIEYEKSRGYIKDYIQNRKQESLSEKSLVLQLGMTYDQVKEIYGPPQFIDKMEDRNQYHEMWTYPSDSSISRLYFNNNMLIRIEE